MGLTKYSQDLPEVPEPMTANFRISHLALLVAGGFAVALGVMVLIGWHLHNALLIQLRPAFMPMSYNTALFFVLCGTGLLAVAWGRSRAGLAVGGFTALFGLLTLSQSILGTDLGIDQLLFEQFVTIGASRPGSVAPNTSLCFILAGAALLIMGRGEGLRQRPLLLGILGSVISSVAMIAFFGYLFGIPHAYGWGHLTQMAVLTAVGFTVLGTGIIAVAWDGDKADGTPRWLPLLVLVGMTTATVVLWQAFAAELRIKSHLDEAVLVFGLVLAVLLALAVHLARTARLRARETMTANRKLASEIAGRLRMEEALRRAEEKYRAIFENANEGIFQTTTDCRFLTANPALARMLGYESAEKLVNYVTDITDCYYRKEDRQEFIRQVEVDGTVHRFEVQFQKQDGALIWVSLTGHVVRDAEGGVLYYEGTATDITESRNLENQLRHAQKMEAVGTLTGGIAHDFNNVLTVIIGHASLLAMRMAKDDPLASHVGQILAAADRVANLTGSLLTFSRKRVLDRNPLDLNDIVKRVEGLLAMLVKEDIELRSFITAGPLVVTADSGQIEQVLINIACNARDAMPIGGILTISTALVDIDHDFIAAHGFGTPGRYALLSLTDTGTGIDSNNREKIFEPFFTTKEVGKGTGLGLSISYGIIKQHQGYIDCCSEPGAGTTFRIFLPLVEQLPVRNDAIPRAEPCPTRETAPGSSA
jgi:PAS domain S-box-containing protein